MEIQIERGIPIPPPLYYRRGRRPRLEGACSCGRMPRPGYKTCDRCLEHVKRIYQKQRAAGLCGWGTSCTNQAEAGHSMCRAHLDQSRSGITKLLKGRIARGVCRQCGQLPRVLGDAAYCVFCRQKNRKGESPIPQKMRKVIRQFWRLDRIDQRRAKAESILPYIKEKRVQEIIRLRHGLIDGSDHTLEEIGHVLGVTRERVRQIESKILRHLEIIGLDVTGLRPPFGDIQRAKKSRSIPENQKKKNKAHRLVMLAINDGQITRQPCEKCGRANAIAHHPDYDKPLEVEWLCRPHHMEAHGRGKGSKRKNAYPAPKGPRDAWWLSRVEPGDHRYAASQIVASLRKHNIKQKDIRAATGLQSPVINLIVSGKEVKDEHLVKVLRYVETLESAPKIL